MNGSLIIHLFVTATMLPAAILAVRRGTASSPAAVLALASVVAWTGVQAAGEWLAGFSGALWLTISMTLILGVGLGTRDARVRRLGVVGYPYLILLGLIAAAWSRVPVSQAADTSHLGWFAAHVVIAVVTYALITLAALAALAVLLQEHALKARRSAGWLRSLPAIADAEAVEFRMLLAGEIVFGLGLATGIATQIVQHGTGALDHKVVFSVLAFVAIGAVLALHARSGLRGRRAAHWVLAGYLLLTLAYPGVKFVRDVLLG